MIVRHRGKIEAVINNAKRAEELVGQEGSLPTMLIVALRQPINYMMRDA